MSANLDIAIYERLAGIETLSGAALVAQTALAAYLATDPDTGRPAVYNSNLNDAKMSDGSGNHVNIYPCLTFTQATGTPIREIWNAQTIHERVIYNVEIWSDVRSALSLKRASENVDRLLDYRFGAVNSLPITDGLVDNSETDIPLNHHYDRTIHAWAVLTRYAITLRRW